MSKPLRCAALPLIASADILANARALEQGIRDTAQAGARLLATPECALCGYPGAARAHLRDVQLCALQDHEDLLHRAAERAGIMLALGTVGLWHQAFSNEILLCGEGGLPHRYRKRALMPSDRQHFCPGPGPLVVERCGWRLGLSICFEVRVSALWAEQASADIFVHAAHMAGEDPDPGCKAQIIPALYAARAAEWATPLLCANTGAADRWLDASAWDARGLALPPQKHGSVLVWDLLPRSAFHPFYGAVRSAALAGINQA